MDTEKIRTAEQGPEAVVREHPAGSPLPRHSVEEIGDLFRRTYFRYFEHSMLGSASRTRFTAVREGRIVGYAAFETHGRYAYIMNMAVDPGHRDYGVALALEQARMRAVRRAGLLCYGTCLCETAASQGLKSLLGMRPANLRYGWYHDMVKQGKHSSVLTVTEADPVPEAVLEPAVIKHPALGVTRYLVDTASTLGTLPDLTETGYLDVLVGPDLAERLHNDDRFRYAGLDVPLPRQSWHHCFQLRNAACRAAVAEEPVLLPRWRDSRGQFREVREFLSRNRTAVVPAPEREEVDT
ncbi:GNAT family N-acetyltransferase [Amycolatopsis halotolerans]|uniref:GNAT family N-acetyltransferase n=1 Tax=Amycolatopsis halotolerans TaxID=330083 RepID=A0ABV7QE96_9PSEU